MKGDALYWSLRSILNWLVWQGELLNPEDLPEGYPVVFVSNHAAALGPIAVASSLPVRLYPWVVGDMLDFNKAPDYLRRDFVERELHLSPPVSAWFARLLSKPAVRLLRSLDCIAVRQGNDLHETFRASTEYLLHGRSLLIFAEDPKQPMNELYWMAPFYKGFTRLGEKYFEQTGKILRFYPLAVHARLRRVIAGKAVAFNPGNDVVSERIRIKHALESTIHELYLAIEIEGYIGSPLPD
jgi:hypothetical protein